MEIVLDSGENELVVGLVINFESLMVVEIKLQKLQKTTTSPCMPNPLNKLFERLPHSGLKLLARQVILPIIRILRND